MHLKQDLLNGLADDELREVITQCNALLQQRDTARKDKALSEARTLLASVGLNLRDLARKGQARSRAPLYHSGRQYQHPDNKTLIWPGKGKKPGWLTALEGEGGKAVEMNDEAVAGKKKGQVSETPTSK